MLNPIHPEYPPCGYSEGMHWLQHCAATQNRTGFSFAESYTPRIPTMWVFGRYALVAAIRRFAKSVSVVSSNHPKQCIPHCETFQKPPSIPASPCTIITDGHGSQLQKIKILNPLSQQVHTACLHLARNTSNPNNPALHMAREASGVGALRRKNGNAIFPRTRRADAARVVPTLRALSRRFARC